MDIKEYNDLMASKKKDAYLTIPIEFRQFIEQVSYERGHSAGQGEVDGIAVGLVSDLKPYLAAYNERMSLIK